MCRDRIIKCGGGILYKFLRSLVGMAEKHCCATPVTQNSSPTINKYIKSEMPLRVA